MRCRADAPERPTNVLNTSSTQRLWKSPGRRTARAVAARIKTRTVHAPPARLLEFSSTGCVVPRTTESSGVQTSICMIVCRTQESTWVCGRAIGRGGQGALVRQNDSWGNAALWAGLIMASLMALWFAQPAHASCMGAASASSEHQPLATLACSGGNRAVSGEGEPGNSGQSEQAKSTFGRQRAACAERGLRAARAPMRLSGPSEPCPGRRLARGPPARAHAL